MKNSRIVLMSLFVVVVSFFTGCDSSQSEEDCGLAYMEQPDTDGDGTNDYCDDDDDNDGVLDVDDNCRRVANPDQTNTDGETFGDGGDACDYDDDDDGFSDEKEEQIGTDPLDYDTDDDGFCDGPVSPFRGACRTTFRMIFDRMGDNCPLVSNENQRDRDRDDIGDVCDDSDGDGVFDDTDNCPEVVNPDQVNVDGDRHGDVCDPCPLRRRWYEPDMDEDGIGDACDEDMDNDGVDNNDDNCPEMANLDQVDTDEDGHGDVCDNCPEISNRRQLNHDRDDHGNVCDDDLDGDNVSNEEDRWPWTWTRTHSP